MAERGVGKAPNTWQELASTSRGQRSASARLLEGRYRHAELWWWQPQLRWPDADPAAAPQFKCGGMALALDRKPQFYFLFGMSGLKPVAHISQEGAVVDMRLFRWEKRDSGSNELEYWSCCSWSSMEKRIQNWLFKRQQRQRAAAALKASSG